MKTPPWVVKLRETNPKAYYSVLTLSVAVVMTNLVLLALVTKMDPRAIGDLLQAAIFLCLAGSVMRLNDRVSKLEKTQKATPMEGSMVAMVTDAKAAALLTGQSETQAEAVAAEVMTAAIKQIGGWKV